MMDMESEHIATKLDIMSRLLAFIVIEDKPANQQIDIFSKAGFKTSDIAVIIGKSKNQIHVTKNRLRKKSEQTSNE